MKCEIYSQDRLEASSVIRQWNTPRENSMFGIIPIVSLTLKWTQNGNLNQSVIYTIRIVLISVCYKLKSQTSNPCVSGRNDPKVIHTRRFQSILRINFTFHWFPPFRFLATVGIMPNSEFSRGVFHCLIDNSKRTFLVNWSRVLRGDTAAT
jgi:hypothetical protein